MMEMTTEIMAEMKKNKDRNGNDNAAPGSGSDGTIFDLITTPRYHGGGSGNDGNEHHGCGNIYIYTI